MKFKLLTSPSFAKVHILSILFLATRRDPRKFPAFTAVAVLAFPSSYLKVPNTGYGKALPRCKKKKNRFYHENSDGSEQGQLEGKYDGSCTERVVIIPYCYRETKLHDRNCSSQLAYPKDIHRIICSLRDTYQWYKLITTGEHVIIASYIFGELNQKFRFC